MSSKEKGCAKVFKDDAAPIETCKVQVGTLDDAKENEKRRAASDNPSRYVYRDFARLEEEEYDLDYEIEQEGLSHALDEATAMAATQVMQQEASVSYVPPTPAVVRASGWVRSQRFPIKLYALLSQPQLTHIISWMPHGRAWKVLKPRLFETAVLPVFFESDNYHSFNRVINAWSFRRKSSGPDRGSYFHELFLRGKPHLQKYMRRLPRTHKKITMDKDDEPDFFELERHSPLPDLVEAKMLLESRKMKRFHHHYQTNTAAERKLRTRLPFSTGIDYGGMAQPKSVRPPMMSRGYELDQDHEGNTEGKERPISSEDHRAGAFIRHEQEQLMYRTGIVEQERYLRMREEEMMYNHQMSRMHASGGGYGLSYAGMRPTGYHNFNPYYLPPPP